MVAADATLFTEVILTDIVANATHSDLNRISLTSVLAANDATFAGLALTLGRNLLRLDDLDGTNGTA